MSNISKLSSLYSKKDNDQITPNREVWGYTRVSSHDQLENRSLINQRNAFEKFVRENDLDLTHVFGNTNESASSDFTRKEFARMFDELKKAPKKPFAILVYTMTRFSRTGAGGVALVYELMYKYNVHLIEVASGLRTDSENDELNLIRRLVEARQENLNRLQATKPGMELHLKEGNWLGKAPLGYDHYGPRVKDPRFFNPTQRIVINEQGKLLQKAWFWKLDGEQDVNIIRKLSSEGLEINKQRLSEVWRKPFYCGAIKHAMLDENIIQGNWEAMISIDHFLKVQEILNGNHSGYAQTKSSEKHPLAKHIKCGKCGSYLTAYTNKKKQRDYYKCNYCSGMNICASKSEKSSKSGALDLYYNLLKSVRIKSEYSDLLKKQLLLTFKYMTKESEERKRKLKKELTEVNLLIEDIKIRFAEGKIPDQEAYNLALKKNQNRKSQLNDQINTLNIKLSNLEPYIDKTIDMASELHFHWKNQGIHIKQRIQNVVFPGGVELASNKESYLTSKTNSIFKLSELLSDSYDGKEKGLTKNKSDKSSVVAGAGLEPATFGL